MSLRLIAKLSLRLRLSHWVLKSISELRRRVTEKLAHRNYHADQRCPVPLSPHNAMMAGVCSDWL